MVLHDTPLDTPKNQKLRSSVIQLRTVWRALSCPAPYPQTNMPYHAAITNFDTITYDSQPESPSRMAISSHSTAAYATNALTKSSSTALRILCCCWSAALSSVSVTQQFNSSTSKGRLTKLAPVLRQFRREIIADCKAGLHEFYALFFKGDAKVGLPERDNVGPVLLDMVRAHVIECINFGFTNI